jgi:peptidoglycan-N-acetylglucosamine deacetylase
VTPVARSAGRRLVSRVRRSRLPTPLRHGPRNAPRVALTVDDGPGRVTEQILDVLARHGARATFNVLGERVRGRERLMLRALEEGHELGNHGFEHERLAGRPIEAYRQLRRTSAEIRQATGVTPRLFRAPYGAVSPGVVLAARLAGLHTVGWDVDSRDYETPGAERIHGRVVSLVQPGSIVLLHDDRRAREQTAFALDEILSDLGGRGYRFVTASELLGLTASRRSRMPTTRPGPRLRRSIR